MFPDRIPPPFHKPRTIVAHCSSVGVCACCFTRASTKKLPRLHSLRRQIDRSPSKSTNVLPIGSYKNILGLKIMLLPYSYFVLQYSPSLNRLAFIVWEFQFRSKFPLDPLCRLFESIFRAVNRYNSLNESLSCFFP